jgi:glucose 1-dehydrogenase
VIHRAVTALGGIDVLVNNAGIHRIRPLLEWTEAEWDQVFAVNVKATLFCAQAAVRLMRDRPFGRIINLSSCSGKKPDLHTAAYNAAKSAVIGLTRCMALEWGPLGITANAIAPGATDTPMLRKLFADSPGVEELLLSRTPLGRIADPTDQANAAVFLASDLARHITGECLVVSGGELMTQ